MMTNEILRARPQTLHAVRTLALLSLLVGVTAAATGGEIQWRSAPSESPASAAPVTAHLSASETLAALAARPALSRAVLHFSAPVDARQRGALEDAGITLLSYLGNNAFFATLHADRLDIAAVERIGNVRAAEAIDPVAKLDPVLAEGETPGWAVVNPGEAAPIIGAYVMFHRDVDLDQEAPPVMGLYGAAVRDVLETVNALVVELPLTVVHDLATEDEVQWIEPALPRLSTTNNSNRARVQADVVQGIPYGLDGSGVTVLVYDGGTARSSHLDFSGRLTVHDGSGMASHATHVSATIGGDGSASSGTYKGMAPGVTILSYGFEYDGSGTFLYTNPGDIESDYGAAIAMGADISNNSIGSNTESNGFACSYQGNYGLTSSVIDAIVRGSVSGGEPFRIVWSAGNERQGDRCDVEGYGDYYSSAPPAGAKNHLCIGALNSNDDSMTSFSSWGPMDDGRLRPDFCAPGCQSDGDGGVTSAFATSDTAYGVYCGTSMSSPTTCGIAALLLQDYRAQFPGDPDPRNSTLKVLFAHNAVDLGNTGPDYQYGYGSLRIKDTIDFMRTGNFFEDEISQGGSVEFVVHVDVGDPVLKATLAWDDYPGTPNVNPTLVNDLDLRVYDPEDNPYYPWTLNPLNPSGAAVQTQEDHLNNIEQVVVNSPQPGTWRIEIIGYDVPEGPQPFSLCAGPNLVPSGIRFNFPGGLPDPLMPGVAESFDVEIMAVTESIIPGSPTLHFRYDGGDWLSASLTPQGDDLYLATLPPPVCTATPEFFISVEGSVSGYVTRPRLAPAEVFAAEVGEFVTPFADDFETDLGWTVGAPDDDAATGIWDRADPEGTEAQPEYDHTLDPGVQCYVTDSRAGESLGAWDVDGGKTTLFSPVFDLASVADPIISYYRWYSNDTGATPNTDVFVVDISNDGGANWTNAETVGPDGPGTSGGWLYHEFSVADVIVPTTQMQMRFIASDEGDGSLVEAALDDFEASSFECLGEFEDCNGNGIVDSDDIASGRSDDNNGNGVPDECDSVGCPGDINFDGVINLDDLAELLGNYGMTSGATFADGDLDDDGDVDLSDLAALLGVYGQYCE
jgi:hypothetical protein